MKLDSSNVNTSRFGPALSINVFTAIWKRCYGSVLLFKWQALYTLVSESFVDALYFQSHYVI